MDISLKWLRIDITAKRGYSPPFFAGSMLRGVLGTALKSVVCINPSYRCDGCFAARECLYYDWYEEKNTYHRYRVTSALAMSQLRFSVWLYEDAVSKLPYVLSAVAKALTQKGLGRERTRVEIESISVAGRKVYENGSFLSLEGIESKLFKPVDDSSDWLIEWKTPLRIKQNNRFARESEGVSLPTVINSIHRRYHELKGIEIPPLGYRVEGEVTKAHWKQLDLHRYSNRQRSRMKLGGLTGMMQIKGLDPKSAAYLQLGELIGVGKQTVFGLGDYRLEPLLSGFDR